MKALNTQDSICLRDVQDDLYLWNHIYSKYWDRPAWENSIDPDQTLQNAASDQGLTLFSIPIPFPPHHKQCYATSTDRKMDNFNFRTSTVRSYGVSILRVNMVLPQNSLSSCWLFVFYSALVNTTPAEPRYVLPLQTVLIQISWLLKKPTDLDLHSLP